VSRLASGSWSGATAAVYACGAVIGVALAGIPLADPHTRPWLFIACVAAAGAAYLGAMVLLLRRPPAGGRPGLLACLAIAALWRLPLLASSPVLSSDVYRYLWDGRIQRLGYNPYVVVPNDPTVAHLHTPATRQMNNPWVPTPYPPAAELFFRGVTAIAESVWAIKTALLLCDALVVVVLLRWLTVCGRSPWGVLAYAWNPVVALEGAGSGHVDLLGALLLVTAALWLTKRRTLLATLAITLAVAVKFLPGVLAPLFWRRVRGRDILAGAALLLALYLPFHGAGLLPTGSLAAYFAVWRFNGPLFAGLERFAPPSVVVGIAVALGVAVASWSRAFVSVDSPSGWAWPIAVTVAFAPSVYPWYLLWLTPFLGTRATLPLAVWTVSSLLTYVVWHPAFQRPGWEPPTWVLWIEYGSIVAAALWSARASVAWPVGERSPTAR
jgi:hypothetical protein